MFSNKEYVKFGGHLLFSEFSLPDTDMPGKNSIIQSENDPKTGKLKFKTFDSESNKFSHSQLKSLKILINFVLPNMTFKGQKLGKDFITNVEPMGAGSFGITIYYKDLIIKVLHVHGSAGESDLIREVTILENLFFDKKVVPPSLNTYYGFMSNEKIGNQCGVNYFAQPSGNRINLYSDLFRGGAVRDPLNTGEHFSIDADNIIANIKQVTNDGKSALDYISKHFLNEFVLLFLDKEDGDLQSYIKNIVPSLDDNTKLVMAKKLLTDIDSALIFMHKTRNVMHFDIKPQNIVYKMGADGVPVFKLIDFGSVMPINPVTGIPKGYHSFTQTFMRRTRHEATRSYMYDRWCLLHCALNILGIPVFNTETVLMLSEDTEEISKKHGADIHGGLNELYTLMTTKFHLSLAPLKTPVTNYGNFMLIFNLLANNNIPNGIPPLK